jgi:hypothetical protein
MDGAPSGLGWVKDCGKARCIKMQWVELNQWVEMNCSSLLAKAGRFIRVAAPEIFRCEACTEATRTEATSEDDGA